MVLPLKTAMSLPQMVLLADSGQSDVNELLLTALPLLEVISRGAVGEAECLLKMLGDFT